MRFLSALNVFDDSSKGVVSRIVGIYGWLIVGNIVSWAWAVALFHDKPLLLGTAMLAYTFGLRHAFDIDHIAAIDNVTRKLMQAERRPIAAGLFFSLGHSTIVVALVVAVALTTISLQNHFEAFKNIGGLIGTSVSSIFLLIIGIANLIVLAQVYRLFRSVRNGGELHEQVLQGLNAKRGFLGRIFGPVLALVNRSWHMYPLGVLFGLGFDTATEIGLLGISAAHASEGLPLWSILVFPALFTAGMSLMDTTDSVIMTGAYGWAFVRPLRKLWYNLTITSASVLVALFIGSVEALGLICDRLKLQGEVWDFVQGLNAHLTNFGFLAVALFLGTWIVSMTIYRLKGYDNYHPAI
jgi:high-affinity nickel-transport protein